MNPMSIPPAVLNMTPGKSHFDGASTTVLWQFMDFAVHLQECQSAAESHTFVAPGGPPPEFCSLCMKSLGIVPTKARSREAIQSAARWNQVEDFLYRPCG